MINIVAIVPARGGSKGIPKKNIKLLAGKPLLAYTIEAAFNSKYINRVVVSTDDDKIANVAREYGAEIVKRPAELATDEATSESAIIHAINQLGDDVEYIAFIQATSPLLKSSIIDEAIEKLMDSRYDSVITLERDYGYYGEIIDGYYHGFRKKRERRQDMIPWFRDNGALYCAHKNIFLQNRRMGDRVGVVEMSQEDSIETDTLFDFWLIEQILKWRKELK